MLAAIVNFQELALEITSDTDVRLVQFSFLLDVYEL